VDVNGTATFECVPLKQNNENRVWKCESSTGKQFIGSAEVKHSFWLCIYFV